MGLYESARSIAAGDADGAMDWAAAGESAKRLVDPGVLDLSDAERAAYADDVRAARDRVGEVAGVAVDLPAAVEVMHRHHWIDANVETFRRLLAPLDREAGRLPGLARTVNTATMAGALALLSKRVLGQYDPALLGGEDHRLYVVHPNVVRTAERLDVDGERFRRWIAFHEVAHAAEFAMAPWLAEYMEAQVTALVDSLGAGAFDRDRLQALDLTMTVVEGYAELLMDRTFDREYADLRETLDRHRRNPGPLAWLVGWLLGLRRKRRQYERGRAFFDAVVEADGVDAAHRVWSAPANLPTDAELETPSLWLRRVG